MVNQYTGTMAYNELGISFVSDTVPKRKANKVYKKMDEIIEKYRELMGEEFEEFLEKLGLESAMGIVCNKEDLK